MRETEEKIKRAKEAQEKREREKIEKAARKKALVDITAGTLRSTTHHRKPFNVLEFDFVARVA